MGRPDVMAVLANPQGGGESSVAPVEVAMADGSSAAGLAGGISAGGSGGLFGAIGTGLSGIGSISLGGLGGAGAFPARQLAIFGILAVLVRRKKVRVTHA